MSVQVLRFTDLSKLLAEGDTNIEPNNQLQKISGTSVTH